MGPKHPLCLGSPTAMCAPVFAGGSIGMFRVARISSSTKRRPRFWVGGRGCTLVSSLDAGVGTASGVERGGLVVCSWGAGFRRAPAGAPVGAVAGLVASPETPKPRAASFCNAAISDFDLCAR